SYYVPATITSGTLTLALVPTAASPDSSAISGSTVGGVANLAPLTAASGSATAYYAVTAASPTAIDSAPIPIYALLTSTTGLNPASNPVTVAVALAGPAAGY